MEKIAKINQLPLKIFFFLVINDMVDTLGQLLMKKGLGSGDLSNPHILIFWIGLFFYVSNFILWMKILSKIDLSVALPLASMSYLLIPLAAVFFLHEHVHALRWLGLFLIMAGIYFISLSESSTRTKFRTFGNDREQQVPHE